MSDVTPLPQELVETVRSTQDTKLVVVRTLLGRPDLTVKPYSTGKPRTWAMQRLELHWQSHASGPGSVTSRGPWRVYKISLCASLRLKAGGISDSVNVTWDLNKGWGDQTKWGTFGYSDSLTRTPDYVLPALDSMLPFDWNTEKDGIPPWRT